MNWLDGLVATMADSPLLAVSVGVLVCLALLLMVSVLAGAPFPWPRRRSEPNPDWIDTQPAGEYPAPSGMQWRTLGPDAGPHLMGRRVLMPKAPPRLPVASPPVLVENLGKTTLFVDVTPPVPRELRDVTPPRFVKVQPGERAVVGQGGNQCCGKCDGSRCSDKPSPSASTMTPQELRTALARTAAASSRPTGQVPPRRNPQQPNLSRENFDAAFRPSTTRRREDSSDAGVPFIGSRSVDSDPPAPAPKVAPFVSGLGGDFSNAGASGSWTASDTCRAPAPSPSYDSGSYSSSSSSDCGGGDSGGGGGGGD